MSASLHGIQEYKRLMSQSIRLSTEAQQRLSESMNQFTSSIVQRLENTQTKERKQQRQKEEERLSRLHAAVQKSRTVGAPWDEYDHYLFCKLFRSNVSPYISDAE